MIDEEKMREASERVQEDFDLMIMKAEWSWRKSMSEWTPYLLRKLFGIVTVSSKSARRGVDKEEAKEHCDVVSLLDRYGIKFRKMGDSLTFCCPFHGDKNPSASFSVKKKKWFCHPEGRGGDVFSFVMEMENCSFPEAIDHVSRG